MMLDSGEVKQSWVELQETFLHFFGAQAYKRWIQPLTFHKNSEGSITLCAPNAHSCDCVREHYVHGMIQLWNQTYAHTLTSIKVISINSHPQIDTNPKNLINSVAFLEKNYQFGNFVVGKSNEIAYSAIKRIADHTSNEPIESLNPLFVYGGVGLGKTHLLHALCWHLSSEKPNRQFIYMSAERFMYHFVSAIRTKNTLEFRKIFRSVDILMVDDIQFIAGKDSTQEEFFHTFNTLVDQKKHIIVSADKSPSELGLEGRVRSRLGCGLVTNIYPATYELRLLILENKAQLLGVHVPGEALELLARKVTSSIRELEGALNSIVAFATLIGKPITMDIVHEALHDLIQTQSLPITIHTVQKHVADHFQISINDLLSHQRLRSIARPRQIAMFLCRELTQNSSTDIGNQFGGKDHTTVVHAVKTVQRIMKNDPVFSEEVLGIKRSLRS